MQKTRIAILGAGSIGTSIARGLVDSGSFVAKDVILTRRRPHLLDEMRKHGSSFKRAIVKP